MLRQCNSSGTPGIGRTVLANGTLPETSLHYRQVLFLQVNEHRQDDNICGVLATIQDCLNGPDDSVDEATKQLASVVTDAVNNRAIANYDSGAQQDAQEFLEHLLQYVPDQIRYPFEFEVRFFSMLLIVNECYFKILALTSRIPLPCNAPVVDNSV